MVDSSEKVLLTGVTGYIGIYVLKDLMTSHPNFAIRCSVRNLGDKEKLAKIEKALGEELYEKIEFVEADLNNEDELRNAIKGV